MPLPSTPLAGWIPLGPSLPLAPPARTEAAMAFDGTEGATVLFGGRNTSVLGFTDTWTFANGQWVNRTPFALNPDDSPSPRFGSSIAWEPKLSSVVLFGGRGVAGPLNDTWRFNSTGWTRLSTPAAPPPRYDAVMADTPGAGGLVLFGGHSGGQTLNDTWRFDGTNWTNLSASLAASPPARYLGSMVTGTGGAAMLFGGFSPQAGFLNDSWLFAGSTWTRLSPAHAPSARCAATLAYDPLDGGVFLFGGRTAAASALGDLWQYSAGDWSAVSLGPTPPPARSSGVMANLSVGSGPTGGLVLFGGAPNGLSELSDTWIYGGHIAVASTPPKVSESPTDTGVPVTVSALAFGGSPPYHYRWLGFPSECPSTDAASLPCTVVGPGHYSLQVRVNDSAGGQTTSGVDLLSVNARPVVTTFTFTPNPIDPGAALLITVATSGGTAPLRYAYANLPAGCVAANTAKLRCSPSSIGQFQVQVTATDAVGVNANASNILTVGAVPPPPFPLSALLELASGAVAIAIVAAGVVLYRRRASARRAASPGPGAGTPPGRGGDAGGGRAG